MLLFGACTACTATVVAGNGLDTIAVTAVVSAVSSVKPLVYFGIVVPDIVVNVVEAYLRLCGGRFGSCGCLNFCALLCLGGWFEPHFDVCYDASAQFDCSCC